MELLLARYYLVASVAVGREALMQAGWRLFEHAVLVVCSSRVCSMCEVELRMRICFYLAPDGGLPESLICGNHS